MVRSELREVEVTLKLDDPPPWIFPAIILAFCGLFFTAPDYVSDGQGVVALDKIPYVWCAIAGVVTLFLFSISLKVYEWAEWGDEERGWFWRAISWSFLPILLSFVVAFLLGAKFEWSYDAATLAALTPYIIFTIYFWLRRPKANADSWD